MGRRVWTLLTLDGHRTRAQLFTILAFWFFDFFRVGGFALLLGAFFAGVKVARITEEARIRERKEEEKAANAGKKKNKKAKKREQEEEENRWEGLFRRGVHVVQQLRRAAMRHA